MMCRMTRAYLSDRTERNSAPVHPTEQDEVGDLALAGLPLLGAYRSLRGGHKLNHAVLTALLADRSAWCVVEGERARRSRPVTDAVGGMVGGLVAPAYGPDVS